MASIDKDKSGEIGSRLPALPLDECFIPSRLYLEGLSEDELLEFSELLEAPVTEDLIRYASDLVSSGPDEEGPPGPLFYSLPSVLCIEERCSFAINGSEVPRLRHNMEMICENRTEGADVLFDRKESGKWSADFLLHAERPIRGEHRVGRWEQLRECLARHDSSISLPVALEPAFWAPCSPVHWPRAVIEIGNGNILEVEGTVRVQGASQSPSNAPDCKTSPAQPQKATRISTIEIDGISLKKWGALMRTVDDLHVLNAAAWDSLLDIALDENPMHTVTNVQNSSDGPPVYFYASRMLFFDGSSIDPIASQLNLVGADDSADRSVSSYEEEYESGLMSKSPDGAWRLDFVDLETSRGKVGGIFIRSGEADKVRVFFIFPTALSACEAQDFAHEILNVASDSDPDLLIYKTSWFEPKVLFGVGSLRVFIR